MNKILKNNLINILFLIYDELLFALMIFDTYHKETEISSFIFIIFISFVITLFTSLFNEKANRIINYIIYFLISLWFAGQFAIKNFMDSFFSFSMFGIADQVTSFMGEVFLVIFHNLYGIILFFLPFIVFVFFSKKISFNTYGIKKCLLIYLILIPLIFCSYRLYLNTKKNEILGIYDLYYNVNNPNLAIQKLGVLSSASLDIYRTIFGFNDKIVKNDKEIYTSTTYEDNVLDISFKKNTPSVIRDYIQNSPPSKKNEYTGYFKDKNLIFIVAESYSEIGVDSKITPTLYKLTHNGFVFNNFYVPYYLSTIGGEFQSLTGLYPDSSILRTWRNGTNTFPYGIATAFKDNGYNTYAFHDHSGYFQDRNKYLKSLGFDNFKACDMGLNINCDVWPESDIELINESTKDYLDSDKPFMSYYMTVSGHLEYTFKDNYIANKNKHLVDNLNLSEKPMAYYASMIELDRALELLINKLNDSSKLADTVIILLADHYPYGLDIDEINELSSYKRDTLFEINHNSLIIWNSKINTVNIDKVGMPIDVLPTIYNLFDISYDSRLFAGTDLLSDTPGLVILNNRSWITNEGKYNSIDNTFTGNNNKEYINYINNNVQNKLSYSKTIINTDGYKYIIENK